GRSTAGPISCEPLPLEVRSGNCTMVLPALVQPPETALKISGLVRLEVLLQSSVRRFPLGSRFHPSSSLRPVLPVVFAAVQVRVEAFRKAAWVFRGFASMKVPSARTTPWASPMPPVHPAGGETAVQVLATGL